MGMRTGALEYLRSRRRLLGYALALVALWGGFYLVTVHACGTPSWGACDIGRAPVCRVVNAVTIPFGIPAEAFVPADGRHYPRAHYVVRAAFAAVFWTGLILLAAMSRAARRGCARSASEGSGLTRRETLGRISDVVVVGAAGAAGLWTLVIEPVRLQLRRYEVRVRDLPEALDGLRIAHLTDTHFGPFIGLADIRAAIERLNDLAPDLTVLTGDYVHRSPDSIEPGIDILGELRARHGVVAVLGNHDHWEGAAACREQFRRIGVPLVDDAHLVLTPAGLGEIEVPGESLAICGVGDLWEDLCDPGRAVQGVSRLCPRLLLSHNPDVAERFPVRFPGIDFDLQLSGHTHGGQVCIPKLGPPMVPSAYGARYEGGLVHGPRWPVIVSRGVGMSIVPVRFLAPPEVSLVVLRRG